MMNSIPRLILASNSPRRQELLKKAGFQFDVFTRDFDEHFPESMSARDVAKFLAIQKNQKYRELLKQEIIITSDTTVVAGDKVLNKPTDRNEAQEMLKSLSDKSHLVISGVCISSTDKTMAFDEVTEVVFHPLSEQEINYYIDHFKPYDKAGAYGIQEWIGLTKVREIRGSFYNVVGLPVDKVYTVLKTDFGL